MGYCNILLWCLAVLAPVWAETPFPEREERQLDSLDRTERGLERRRAAYSDSAARISRELEELRGAAGADPSPLERRRRNRLMAAAKGVSDSLTRLERELSALDGRRRTVLTRLTDVCGRLLQGGAPPGQQERCTRLLPEWRQRLAGGRERVTGPGEMKPEGLAPRDGDGLFDLQRKAELLGAYLQDVDTERKALQDAVGELRFDIRTAESGDRFRRPDMGLDDGDGRMLSGTDTDVYPLEIRLRNREEELRSLDGLRKRLLALQAAVMDKISHLTD